MRCTAVCSVTHCHNLADVQGGPPGVAPPPMHTFASCGAPAGVYNSMGHPPAQVQHEGLAGDPGGSQQGGPGPKREGRSGQHQGARGKGRGRGDRGRGQNTKFVYVAHGAGNGGGETRQRARTLACLVPPCKPSATSIELACFLQLMEQQRKPLGRPSRAANCTAGQACQLTTSVLRSDELGVNSVEDHMFSLSPWEVGISLRSNFGVSKAGMEVLASSQTG